MKKQQMIGIIILGCFFMSGCFGPNAPQVCFDEVCLDVELALTDAQQTQGLQYRESLKRDKGMLFVFGEPSQVAFWMKNTLISLDIIWLDQRKKIIYIEKNTPPCLQEKCPTYGPAESCRYVLEANAGWADANDISIGDRAEFNVMDK